MTSEEQRNHVDEHLEEQYRELLDRCKRISVRFLPVHDGPIATYPSEWFERNAGLKPDLWLPKLLDTDSYAGLKKPIAEGITKGASVSSRDIELFLQFLLKQVKETAPMDWISMGVVIAKKGDKIGPLDLFTLKVEETTDDRAKVAEQEDSEKLAYLILITGCYRMSKEQNKFQRERLMKLISAKVAEAGLRGRYAENCLKAMNFAFIDQQLTKLLSGMDMFYNLFSDSEYARSRVGTECLRFKDCSALGYLNYLADFMKMEPKDIPEWFLAHSLKQEWERINFPNQEINDPFSYMPYMMGLQLARKSPYSASSNPSFYNFVHLIGCAALQPRSINAKMFKVLRMDSLVDNAVLFYYAICRTTDPEGSVIRGASLLSVDAANASASKEPKSIRAADWHAYVAVPSGKRSVALEYIRQAVYRIWATIESPREGTIGAYAKSRAIAALGACRK